jgi:hypothetical protein
LPGWSRSLSVENQQVGGGGAGMVEGKELIPSEPVVLGGCLADVVGLNWIPFGHERIVRHSPAAKVTEAVTASSQRRTCRRRGRAVTR